MTATIRRQDGPEAFARNCDLSTGVCRTVWLAT
jgi:hypothetical protein